jgi:hypothetical protein
VHYVLNSHTLGSTTTTSGIHQAVFRCLRPARRRVLRGLRRDHGSRDHSDRLLLVSGRDEYGAPGGSSDLASQRRGMAQLCSSSHRYPPRNKSCYGMLLAFTTDSRRDMALNHARPHPKDETYH